ncbi:MOSC domain-containing protein [Roseomonas xinghualingensis]|uniref:MOSC domain-containing protein n=1 Tax=Roseomonas xinghualingensis TaxID=2986475 RepID=UPI0021F12288|nr:MOSC domain-containing protein [Roseomonas sp. SXEYE001]MCV4208970.1 MOSC domain-containing protein [Roseomonas sp. SXEYE001]
MTRDLFGEVPPPRGPAPGSMLARLIDGPMAPGRVAWIGLRPARRAPMQVVEAAMAESGQGLVGDRFSSSRNGARQVTLVAEEHLRAIAGFLSHPEVPPERLRRNIVVAGINLLALRNRRFRIGGALLEFSGDCHPCSRMEEELGPGGYNAARGHGGITARVLEGGPIRLGDAVERLLDHPT